MTRLLVGRWAPCLGRRPSGDTGYCPRARAHGRVAAIGLNILSHGAADAFRLMLGEDFVPLRVAMQHRRIAAPAKWSWS